MSRSGAGRGAGRLPSIQQGADRPAHRAGRAVPRRAALAGADGRHLPCRRRRGGALVARQPGRKGRRRCGTRRRQAVGPERAVAGRLPAGHRHDGREPDVGEGPRRRLPAAARGRDGFGAEAARGGAARGQPRLGRAHQRDRGVASAGGLRASGRRAAAAAAGHRHRAAQSAGGLRADVQPGARVRTVDVARVSAGIHPAAAGILVVPPDLGRYLVGRGRGRDARDVGSPALVEPARDDQRAPPQPDPPPPPDRPVGPRTR